ncbi:MAG: helix-turn-helix domain-containing protein, partial [Muribaculaceae bacterium]|nr:helix-turn-helix domain-containing protein [Muribaculaceae bacterium]
MNWLRIMIYFAASIAVVLSGCSERGDSYDHEVALRRVLTVQKLQNMNPGDPTVVPQIEMIVDSMRKSGKDPCYFGAVNVLIDRLFADGRYAEADSLAVRMQNEADEETDSLAMAMAKRVRAQILYKLSQSGPALQEALSALPYANDPLKSGTHFGTATSLDEWIHIIARAKSDTAIMTQAGNHYAETVKRNISKNSWSDPTGHYPVTALAFEAENAFLNNNASQAALLLDSALRHVDISLPARAYEHFYDVRSRFRASRGDFAGALADVDTLLKTHRCFPWFYLRDLQLKAEVQNAAGLHEESARTYSHYIAYHDSLSSRLTDRRLHDLTVLYRTELDRKERRANAIRFIGLGSVSILLLVLFGVTLRHAVNERKRNRLLVERLQEYDRAEMSLLRSISEETKKTEEMSPIARLDRHMIVDQPYTDPGLGRKELAEYLGINQESLAQLIRSERDSSVHAYINSFRLEEARRVLDSE